MKMSKWVKLATLGATVVALAACSTTGKKQLSSNTASGAANNNASAQAYAMRAQRGFKKNTVGLRVNPLAVPADQTYYFAFDSSSMRPTDLNALDVQARFLATHSNAKIRLAGNTDERGSREYNIGLGWRRDQSVTRLLEQQGVKSSQIQMVSYGKERPVALGHSEQIWAKNRRVDLFYK